MAKLQLVSEHKQSDLDTLIMEQAEKDELDAMRERMHTLLRDFYKADVHPFRVVVSTKHNDGAVTSMYAAQGGTHGHKD